MKAHMTPGSTILINGQSFLVVDGCIRDEVLLNVKAALAKAAEIASGIGDIHCTISLDHPGGPVTMDELRQALAQHPVPGIPPVPRRKKAQWKTEQRGRRAA